MDDLTTTLMQRAITDSHVPNPHATTPPAAKRAATADKMIAGYRNNWNPNPILTRIIEGT